MPDFAALYQQHYSRVFGLCLRLLASASLAEDATQEAFMRAYSRLKQYDASKPFWQWIATIANHYCIDLLRKNSKTEALFSNEEDELALATASDKSSEAMLVESQTQAQLCAAIDQLPDKYRVPLVMLYFNESSYQDIAAQLDISVSHVGVLILRAKQMLQRQLPLSEVNP